MATGKHTSITLLRILRRSTVCLTSEQQRPIWCVSRSGEQRARHIEIWRAEGRDTYLTLMPESNIMHMPMLMFPNRLCSRFLLLAVDPIANGPSRVNNPPKPRLGGFTNPPIPKPALRSDPHDRHKSRYGFCHVLSCLTMLMQCFCLVSILISTIASFVSVMSS
jgi:hypothetical protein